MAYEEYAKALKLGEHAYRSAVSRGEYPYLPALDELLERTDVQTEVSLGLVDIPLDRIVGTKTVGRTSSFAANFMPLMPEGSEFASKWMNLLQYQTEEGVRDPIVAYEFMNRFYVLEGNKRVSVFKYLHASSIEGTVTRVIPRKTGETENRIYYEFLDFYRNTRINDIWFTRTGSFAKLIQAVGKNQDEEWSQEERREFSSSFSVFEKLFREKGGEKLSVTAGDAFLFYLTLYPYHAISDKSTGQLKEELNRIWSELALMERSPEKSLVLTPEEKAAPGLFSRFFSVTSSKTLKAAFVHDKCTENSSWTYSHELGRMYLEQIFGDQIQTESYFLEREKMSGADLLEMAVRDGNHIIFTTSQKFLDVSLKAALEHPRVRILNCSLNRPYGALRTYYGRMYEAKFLSGLIAGAMCRHDRIAYVADFPIFGSLANVNAFARGAAMTNPRAKIYLHWTSDRNGDLNRLLREEHISTISGMDMIRPSAAGRRYGLYQTDGEDCRNLATPIWNWGKFYEKIIRDILQGTWKKGQDSKCRRAVNYWWGISGDIIDLIISQNLPLGIRSLTEIMRKEIYTDNFHPFQGEITAADGRIVGEKNACLSPEEIITMDWLAENVVGRIPPGRDLTPEAAALIKLQGIAGVGDGDCP